MRVTAGCLLLPGLWPPGRVVKPGRGSRPGLAGGGDGPVLVRLGETASAHGEERGRRALRSLPIYLSSCLSINIYLSIYLSIFPSLSPPASALRRRR